MTNNTVQWCPNQEEAAMIEQRKTLINFAEGHRRFPSAILEERREFQLEQREKIVARLAFKPFAPTSEKDVEDWVDGASRQVRQEQLCVEIFQFAWEIASKESIAQLIAKVEIPKTHEELVDKVVRKLFPNSGYVHQLEDKMYAGKRQAATLMAITWLKHVMGRYVRVARRRDFIPFLPENRLREVLLRTLPVVVEQEIRRTRRTPSLEIIMEDAAFVEEELMRIHGMLPQPATRIYAVEENNQKRALEELNTGNMEDVNAKHTRKPQGACFGCGREGHFRKDCPMRKARCKNCRRIGHTSTICQNLAVHDQERGSEP